MIDSLTRYRTVLSWIASSRCRVAVEVGQSEGRAEGCICDSCMASRALAGTMADPEIDELRAFLAAGFGVAV